jgi:hypothetical protein
LDLLSSGLHRNDIGTGGFDMRVLGGFHRPQPLNVRYFRADIGFRLNNPGLIIPVINRYQNVILLDGLVVIDGYVRHITLHSGAD